MRRFLKTNTALLLLRLALGWLLLYSGLSNFLNPNFTAKGFLENAQTFSGFYGWLASPNVIGIVDFLNEWGLILIGGSLILGVFVRLSSYLGVVLMLLYYFPTLSFPFIGAYSFLVDEHIIYALAFLVLVSSHIGHHHFSIFGSRMKY